ncbi:MAG TPA: hypothetical protein PKW30_05985 [Campylobacterales bacterium]|nr:hypothetical protein [Campylobacterales bacterium]
MKKYPSFGGLVHKKELEKMLGIDYRQMRVFLNEGRFAPMVYRSRKTMYFDVKQVYKSLGLECPKCY